jgi:gentisate 1,2-dioxygenase
MPTIDCYAMALPAGRATQRCRTTASGVCFVIAGEGRSVIGDEVIGWAKNDVFTLPHWHWTSHAASGAGAYLAIANNHEMLHRLGLLRSETEDGTVSSRR